jgi:hypothetical protein
VIAYRFLKPDGSSVFTGFKWELPTGRPGPWVESAIEPCRSGIHACRPEHLPLWAGHLEFEAAGGILGVGGGLGLHPADK